MIDINIAPHNIRKKKQKSFLGSGFKIPLEIVIGIGGGLLMFLVLVHFYLLFMNISHLSHHRKLKKEWPDLLPAKENVDIVIKEMKALKDKNTAIEGLLSGNNILWSKKLNLISDDMPQGVWLKKIAFSGDTFYLDGSAISRQKKADLNAHSLVAKLESDKEFLMYFSEINIGSIQSRNVGKSKIADFLITINLDNK